MICIHYYVLYVRVDLVISRENNENLARSHEVIHVIRLLFACLYFTDDK
jgi:hypothetical protein